MCRRGPPRRSTVPWTVETYFRAIVTVKKEKADAEASAFLFMERVTRLVCIFAAQKSHAHFYCAKISRMRGIRSFRQNKKPGQSPTKWVCPGKGGTALWVRSAPKGLNKRYNACTDAVTRLVCIFAAQKSHEPAFPVSEVERVTRLVCIFAAQKLMFGSVKPSPPTVHRTGTGFAKDCFSALS